MLPKQKYVCHPSVSNEDSHTLQRLKIISPTNHKTTTTTTTKTKKEKKPVYFQTNKISNNFDEIENKNIVF